MTAIPAAGGTFRTGFVMLVVSLLLGLGIAFAAAATIVSTNGPGDDTAFSEGPGAPVDPASLLRYGG